mgnify:CR=1 FL=1
MHASTYLYIWCCDISNYLGYIRWKTTRLESGFCLHAASNLFFLFWLTKLMSSVRTLEYVKTLLPKLINN